MNARLRVALEKARAESLPKENIERAIKRGTGEIEGENYEELTYEGVGPGGVAIMVDCFSENKNRTVAELRLALSRNGGNMTDNGSVSWQFKATGQIIVPGEGVDEDDLTMAALEGGADDVLNADGVFVVLTPIDALHTCNDELSKAGFQTSEVELTRLATNKVDLSDEEMRQTIALLDALDELDDVKETQINADIPDEMYQEA